MMNSPCIICRQKNTEDGQLTQLRRIRDLLSRELEADTNTRQNHCLWHTSIRCKYGLTCPTLNNMEVQCRALEREIERYFDPLVRSGNTRLYHDTLHLLQGYFPAAYRDLEREWSNNHH